jgi:hypothetical protein
MTVEAYLRSKVAGYPFDDAVLESAALSPLFARPTKLDKLALDGDIEEIAEDENLQKSLKYAESSIYYSVSGVFSGGSRSEQIGDVKSSLSGYTITQADRDYYRKLADSLRDEIECEKEVDPTDDNGLFDAGTMFGW